MHHSIFSSSFNIVLTGRWWYFSIWSYRISKLLPASSCSQERQVHRLLMSFDYFYQTICKVLYLSLLHWKAKYYFTIINMTMWWAMEPWYVLMVEVPLQGFYSSRTNHQCRLVILAPYIYIALTIRSIMALGKSAVSFPSCTPTDLIGPGGVLG